MAKVDGPHRYWTPVSRHIVMPIDALGAPTSGKPRLTWIRADQKREIADHLCPVSS